MSISPKNLYNELVNNNIEFFTGVPDSLLKEFCFYIDEQVPKSNHIISTSIDSILTDFSSNIEIIDSEINRSILLTSSKKSKLIYSGGEVSLDILRNPPLKNDFNKGKQIISVLSEYYNYNNGKNNKQNIGFIIIQIK